MPQRIKDIPHLRFRWQSNRPAPPAFDPAGKYHIDYHAQQHRELPHVVKFSGGRSSGMMLFTLLHNKVLQAKRGDVVVFNNTSAEHPATYEFAAKCKALCEEEYGIPFFWTEFQTYEDASRGRWARHPAYRLVLPQPASEKQPNGYHARGEVFEELLSWQRFVPNQHDRICTARMKLFVTKDFLGDWFAVKPSIDRLGHYYGEPMMQDSEVITAHRQSSGSTPPEVLLEKAQFVRTRPPFRPEQDFADYSSVAVKIANSHLADKSLGGRVALSGDDCVDYVTFVGFRGDEPARVARMRARNMSRGDDDCESDNDPHTALPEGEYVYAPLAEMNVSKEDVFAFWKKQDWDLRLPHTANYSNCVYCFLKGSATLADIVARREKVEKRLPKKLRAQPDTPADINWWVKMEAKYARDLRREKRKVRNKDMAAGEKPLIGFWGINSRLSYHRLAEAENRPASLKQIETDNAALPCDCTD